MSFTQDFLSDVGKIASLIDQAEVESCVGKIGAIRTMGGRLFILGVGGSAANASHAVNDFRKLCGVEAYAPTDNVSELTAITNDDGWEWVFSRWLGESRLSERDGLLILSVGGGNAEKNVSVNLVNAMLFAKKKGAFIIGIVGRDGGETKKLADKCVIIPTVTPEFVTPHAESFQAVIWHLFVSHPHLKLNPTKW